MCIFLSYTPFSSYNQNSNVLFWFLVHNIFSGRKKAFLLEFHSMFNESSPYIFDRSNEFSPKTHFSTRLLVLFVKSKIVVTMKCENPLFSFPVCEVLQVATGWQSQKQIFWCVRIMPNSNGISSFRKMHLLRFWNTIVVQCFISD